MSFINSQHPFFIDGVKQIYTKLTMSTGELELVELPGIKGYGDVARRVGLSLSGTNTKFELTKPGLTISEVLELEKLTKNLETGVKSICEFQKLRFPVVIFTRPENLFEGKEEVTVSFIRVD